MTPGIERCEAAVVAALESIQVANGYRTDVGRVYRVPLNEDQLPDGANLVVVPVSDGMTFDDQSAGGTIDLPKGTVKVTDRLIIGGVIQAGTADLLEPDRVTLSNLFLEDVCDALTEDPHFGLDACDSRLEAVDRGVDADRGFGYFTLRMHLTYYFARGTMR